MRFGRFKSGDKRFVNKPSDTFFVTLAKDIKHVVTMVL